MEPLLRQVSLAWENPTHLPGHSLQAPAEGSAPVSLRHLPIAMRVCVTPQQPGQDQAGSQAQRWQRRRGAGPGACRRRRARPPRPVPLAPKEPAAPSRAREPGVHRAGPARPPGSASRTHSAFPPYLPAAPPSPARKFRTTPSPGAQLRARSQARRHPAPPEHRLFRLQSCQLRGADADEGRALRSRRERRCLLSALHRPWTALQAPPPILPASLKHP